MTLAVKVCGLSAPDSMAAAIEAGARFVGFVFYPPSPRAVSPAMAAELARLAPTGVRAVGLFVDPDDESLDAVLSQVPLDMLQLHGAETPARVAAVRERFAMPVMKAVRVAATADVDAAEPFDQVADWLLFDAKPPRNVHALPGGNGIPFDWSLLAGRQWRRPWMLSGGLTAGNLAAAVAATGAAAVDVSSGVEDRPGHKPPARVRSFLQAARAL